MCNRDPRRLGRLGCLALLCLCPTTSTGHAGSHPAAAPADLQRQRFLLTRAEVPLYPELALAARISGAVRVRLLVGDGATLQAEGDPGAPELLRLAAEANARTWRFARGTDGGLEVEYAYELIGDATDVPENPRVEMEIPWRVRIVGRPARSAAPRRRQQ